jgi:UDP-N-acetyl-D-mannosaminuronate dehydrogenase
VGAQEVERVADLATAKADLIVLLTNHAEYRAAEALPSGIPVLDTRGALRGADGVEAL